MLVKMLHWMLFRMLRLMLLKVTIRILLKQTVRMLRKMFPRHRKFSKQDQVFHKLRLRMLMDKTENLR